MVRAPHCGDFQPVCQRDIRVFYSYLLSLTASEPMKSKFSKILSPEKPEDQDHENDVTENEESSEVDSGGPAIASAKKNRIVVIAFSSVLIAVVAYFVFFKEGAPEKQSEKLQEVVVPPTRVVAASEEGKSPFEIEIPKEKPKEEVELLEKPAVPQIPALPDNVALPADQAVVIPPTTPVPNAPVTPVAPVPGQALLPNQKPQESAQGEGAKSAEKSQDVNPRYAPIVVFSGGGDSPSLGVGYDKNIVKLKEDPFDSMDKAKTDIKTSYIQDRTHSIVQGKLLTAVLETAINTQIPGSVRGIISRDVYGESGNEVLIPKGSRLYGSYSSQVVRGQARVDISWTRLIRPDGVSVNITFKGSDQFGRAGIPGDVDNKYSSIIAGSLLTSVLAVSTAAAANKFLGGNNTNISTTTANGATTTTGSAANQAIADVTKTIIDTAGQIVGNSINTTPVITVPQGTKITVIVNGDMKLPSISTRR